MPKTTNTTTDRELIENMTEQLKRMESKLDKSVKEADEQRKKIAHLESELKKRDRTIVELSEQVMFNSEMIDDLQQRSRLSNIIIDGVQESKDEDVYKIVEVLGKRLGISNPSQDIQAAHRVFSKNTSKPKPIVVRLLNSKTRDKWTKSYRAKKLWTEKVYINEHLTLKNQKLLAEAKKKAKENNFKYTWVKDCKILVRRNEKSKVFTIRKMEDLDLAFRKPSNTSQTESPELEFSQFS